LLAENRLTIEKEMKENSCQYNQQGVNEKVVTVTNDESSHRHWKPLPVPSIRHPIVVASRADEDFLTIIEHFEKTQEEHHK